MLRCFFIACKITFFISRRQVLTPHFFTADVLSINKEERGAVRRKGLTISHRLPLRLAFLLLCLRFLVLLEVCRSKNTYYNGAAIISILL